MGKSKLTTTIDTDLLKKIKIEAIKREMNVNDIMEELIKAYFSEKEKDGN